MSSITTYTTDEGLLPMIPNDWFDYFSHEQQFMDDFEVPFIGGTGTAEAAISDNTSFGDDVCILGSEDIFDTSGGGGGGCGYDAAASLEVTGSDETLFTGRATSLDITTTNSAAAATAISPENSTGGSNNSHVGLSPKAGIAKQIKRRSRASRRTPVTLLNASIKNFRTVVQQYTGIQSSNYGFNRNGKGPITLSFGGPNNQNDFPVLVGNYFYTQEGRDYQQQINSFADF